MFVLRNLLSTFTLLAATAFAQETSSAHQVIFEVPKMMCGGCTGRVKKSIESHKGISNVFVTLDDHTARFTCDEKSGCDLERIKKDLARIQYPAKELAK